MPCQQAAPAPRSPRLEAARASLSGLASDGVGRLRRLASDAEERTSGSPGPCPDPSLGRSPSPRGALLDSGGTVGGNPPGGLFNVQLSSGERTRSPSPSARAAAMFAAQAERVRDSSPFLLQKSV